MKLQKRILLIFLILMLLLTVKCFAYSAGDTITYNGITTEMPEIITGEDVNLEEDPIYIKLSSTPALMSVEDGTSVSSIISTFEATGDVAVGIDVSYYQENIDWATVANSRVKFAMIRCRI